ncbi:hypothetical protein AU186_22600 [Mycobacterium sp. GA-1999]|nr:hypothetical protein AU186_22600 [Mycobacterium sp. GA-1999]KUH91401.1 hypothetical protein AU185_09665 [Mycobacterium sp. GA-0227b]KUH96344.1 hypothetical protein AU187_14180 [Mycobacterium sp. IS-1556]
MVVERLLETKFVAQPFMLSSAIGAADNPVTARMRKLTHQTADRACGTGRNHRVSGVQARNVEQPDISGQAGNAEHYQICAQRCDARVDDQGVCVTNHRQVAPSGVVLQIRTH